MCKNKLEEYYCTNEKEKEYLISQGFKYNFVKEIMDTKKTTVWKFTKSSELFSALLQYQNNN